MIDPETGGIRTPLFELHTSLGGRMVSFGGHALPMRFEGTVAEHRATRSAAGLFDVSHMGIVDLFPAAVPGGGGIAGGASSLDGVARWLEQCVPAEVTLLGRGRMRYTLFTTPTGGVLDDLIVSRLEDRIRLVVNAVRTEADLALLRALNRGADAGADGGEGDGANDWGHVRIEVRDDLALLALQGPAAAEVIERGAPNAAEMGFMHTETLSVFGAACEVSRSGYTGEDGFEIAMAADDAVRVAERLLEFDEVSPAGLGARDTLRLEAGLPLVGKELTGSISPIEAGLRWAVPKARREAGDFPGADVIEAQCENGPARRRVGISASGRRPIRDGAALTCPDGTPAGEVTSGGFGPTVDAPVAMAYVRAELAADGTELLAEGRKGPEPCTVTSLPFVSHRDPKIPKSQTTSERTI